MALEAGTIIGGKYRLRKEIGSGGMGAVWSAVHDTLDRNVAIKFLRPSPEDPDSSAARFVSEAKLAARVKHRFVVDVFDFGITEDGVYYMVQELLEGEELASGLSHGPAWQVRDAVQLISQCLNGLEAVHQAGIVHRDLKPENIFVIRDLEGRFPKVLDFGISKLSDATVPRTGSSRTGDRTGRTGDRTGRTGDRTGRTADRTGRTADRTGRTRHITSAGQTVGTPWYMSPEQLRGRRDLDGRADVYSMGVILYEWLTGAVPYAQENVAELSLQVSSGSAVPLVSLRPELGHEVSAVVARALAPEREERFASAAAMREALQAALPQLPSAWTIVQYVKAEAPSGDVSDLLARAAADDVAARRERAADLQVAGVGSGRLQQWMIGVGLAITIGLLSMPLFLRARPEVAAAKSDNVGVGRGSAEASPSAPRLGSVEPAPQGQPTVESLEKVPDGHAEASASPQHEPLGESQTKVLDGSARAGVSTSVPDAATTSAPSRPRVSDSPSGRARAAAATKRRPRPKRASRQPAKKVIRTLDF